MSNQTITQGTPCVVHTLRGSWSALVVEVNEELGWFRIGKCENPKLNTAAFDLKKQIKPYQIANFNCAIEPKPDGELLHHYNCWATFPIAA